MPRYQTTRRVRHSAATMFALVADVERYPEFVPMCERLSVRRRSTDERGRTILVAEMSIGYKMIRETFTSRVTLDDAARHILVEYVDGPFQHLVNHWRFVPVGDGCDVLFDIDYEFKSRAFRLLAGAVFDAVFKRMAGAFEARADAIR